MLISIVSSAKAPNIGGVARVIEGDRLSIGPVIVRLHGIDAPEAGQQCRRANGGSWRW